MNFTTLILQNLIIIVICHVFRLVIKTRAFLRSDTSKLVAGKQK